jgi:hypothetical protein
MLNPAGGEKRVTAEHILNNPQELRLILGLLACRLNIPKTGRSCDAI